MKKNFDQCQSQEMAAPGMIQIQISGASNTVLLQTACAGSISLMSPQQYPPPPWAWDQPPQEQRTLMLPLAQEDCG